MRRSWTWLEVKWEKHRNGKIEAKYTIELELSKLSTAFSCVKLRSFIKPYHLMHQHPFFAPFHLSENFSMKLLICHNVKSIAILANQN